MKVTLKIMGPAKRRIKDNPAELEVAEGSRIVDMMLSLGYTEIEARHLVYVRDEETVKLTEPLSDGDSIKAVLQMGGG